MNNTFSNDGYLIIREAISQNLINEIHCELYNYFTNYNSKGNYYSNKCYEIFSSKVNNLTISEYDFQQPIWDLLSYKNLIKKLFLEPKFYDSISNLLGKDLVYLDAPSFNINIPKKKSSKENYLFKDWHQEIWSGASISSIQIWTPIMQKNSRQGQIELMIDSHKNGFIPNRNRVPKELPKNYKTLKTNLEYRDIIIFSTLMLHRSLVANYPRLSLTAQIRNYKYKNYSFQNENNNWKIISISELTKIEKILGNHYINAFRTGNIDTNLY